jgi:hypothetical protein
MTAQDRGPERAKATNTGRELERRVADAYRAMGARKVEHDVELTGNQIDVYVELETPGRLLHRIAVEAKDWASTVGIDVVNKFAVIVNLLRGKGLIDEGVIVSAAGFSKQARNAARDYSIRLLESADLDAMVTEVQATRPTTSPPSTILTAPPTPRPGEGEEEDERPSPAEVVTPDKHDYDAFISYSHRNQEWVRGWLLPQLEETGVRVFIDFRDFEPGAPLLTEMERAVLESRKMLLVLTPDYLASEWAEFENILASTLDPAARRRRVIPLLLKPCELPLRIRTLTYLDFTGSEDEFQFQRLLAAIRSEPKPDQPLPTTQPAPAKPLDLRLLTAHLTSGKRSASRLEFSIPPTNPEEKTAWEIAFRLYLDNQGPTMARYVDVEMCASSDTDSFWIYDYKDKPFDIVESPRPWKTTLSEARIHCRFVGGVDFVCHSKVQQNLGLVKMLVPYGQADTTVTFRYRILAKGYESQGCFAIALGPER